MRIRSGLAFLFKKRLFKLLFFFGLTVLLGAILQVILDHKAMSIPRLELDAAKDLCLNDLHYKINKKTKQYLPSDKIILINTGDMSSDQFRSELAELIQMVSLYEAKVIGIDHVFSNNTGIEGSRELFHELASNPKLVLALDTANKNAFIPPTSTFGSVNLIMDPYTIRKYEGGRKSFAAQIARKYDSKSEIPEDPFLINYIARDFSPLKFTKEALNEYQFSTTNDLTLNLPMFNSHDVMEGNASTIIKDKIVIIGHFGTTSLRDLKNDMEDKFPVPCEDNMIFRSATMPGALIHANAVENLIRKEIRFIEYSATWWFKGLTLILTLGYLYFLLFVDAGKVINILLLFLLSLPSLYLVLIGMQYGWYFEMGSTLLQLLVYEEMVEIFNPLYIWIEKKLKPSL